MKKRPFTVSLAQGLILLVALLWLGFGGIVAANAHPTLPDQPVIKGVLSIGAFITAAASLLLWSLLNKRKRMAYSLSLGLFAIFILVTFFDDVGWVDLIFLGLCAVVLFFLVKDRKWYLEKKSDEN